MQDTVEVIINEPKEGVLTCTTLNEFQNYEPLESEYKYRYEYKRHHLKWRQAESERKTYEIVNQESSLHTVVDPECCGNLINGNYCCNNPIPKERVIGEQWKFEPGTIHKAQIINNKAVIQ